jgi:hypothetical protein
MGNSASHGIVIDDDDLDTPNDAFRPPSMEADRCRATPPRKIDLRGPNHGSPLPQRTPSRSFSPPQKLPEASPTTPINTSPRNPSQTGFFQGLLLDVSRAWEDTECSSHSSSDQPYCAECITGACTGLDRRGERVEMRWSAGERSREEIKSKERFANVPPIVFADKHSLRQFMSPRLKNQYKAGISDEGEHDDPRFMPDDVVLEV